MYTVRFGRFPFHVLPFHRFAVSVRPQKLLSLARSSRPLRQFAPFIMHSLIINIISCIIIIIIIIVIIMIIIIIVNMISFPFHALLFRRFAASELRSLHCVPRFPSCRFRQLAVSAILFTNCNTTNVTNTTNNNDNDNNTKANDNNNNTPFRWPR